MKELHNQPSYILISEFQNGNPKAIEILYNRYHKDLYNFILFKTFNEYIAEEILQETFAKALVILKKQTYKYQEQGKFFFWLRRIAENMIIDIYRKNKKRYDVPNHSENYEIQIPDTSINIEEKLIQKQIYNELHTLLLMLPKTQQDIVKLRFFENLSFKEIADVKNISINTALGTIRYAILNLRKLAKEYNVILSA